MKSVTGCRSLVTLIVVWIDTGRIIRYEFKLVCRYFLAIYYLFVSLKDVLIDKFEIDGQMFIIKNTYTIHVSKLLIITFAFKGAIIKLNKKRDLLKDLVVR